MARARTHSPYRRRRGMPRRFVAAAQMAAAFAVLLSVNAYVFLWRKRTSLPELHKRADDDRHGMLPSAAIVPEANGASGARSKGKSSAPPTVNGAQQWLVLPLAGSTLGERLADTSLPSVGMPAALLDSTEYTRATAYVGQLADGQPVAIDLQQPNGRTEFWRRAGKSWSAIPEDRPLKVKQVALQGATASSLQEAVQRLPAHETLAPLVATLLGGEIDFDEQENRDGGKHRVRVLVDRFEVGGQLYRHGHIVALEWQSDRRGTLRAVEYPADSGRYYGDRGENATRRWLRSPFEAAVGNPSRKVERAALGEWRAVAGTPVTSMSEGRIAVLTKTSKGAQVTIARDDLQITVRGAFRPTPSLRVGATVSRGQRLGELVGSKEPGATSSLFVELQVGGKRVETPLAPPREPPCPAADRPQLGEVLARTLKELQTAEQKLAQR